MQHSELISVVGTELKPDLKLNGANQTTNGDLPLKPKGSEFECCSKLPERKLRTNTYIKMKFNEKRAGATSEKLKDFLLSFETTGRRMLS
ncbi:unnamed protein product [Hymenolepis diminuta]|uniref:Uncharacterized protein n=1 Tax=Hymenolepis diminuta TaxID=6216 RepID=A0A564Y4H0_HYMDI|nr:unnamed protein product [Hymenolepis diminuta]